MYTKVLATKAARSISKEAFHDIVLDLVQCHSNLYICIDGLDECELVERKEILSLILRIVHSNPKLGSRVFVAACAERDIEQSLRESLRLALTRLHLHSDITVYLRRTAEELGRKWATNLRTSYHLCADEIYERVAKRPEGLGTHCRLMNLLLMRDRNVSSRNSYHGELARPGNFWGSRGRTPPGCPSTRYRASVSVRWGLGLFSCHN